jgi:nitrous oxidase accessory protein
MSVLSRLAVLVCVLFLVAVPKATDASAPRQSRTLVVSPDGPFTTLRAALEQAQDGDTIQVQGGIHPGPLVVERSLRLEGIGWPVIDAGGVGTVVSLSASGIVFQGFVVRGSGVEPDRDHAGITLTAPDITVANNRLEDVLFGIFVAQADRAVLSQNQISSKAQYELARKGDGIRLWYSHGVTVKGNIVRQARDVVMWYSSDVTVVDNLIEGGRYGIHLMYCDRARIESNHLLNNSVGIYTMYSREVLLRENDVRGQRGPSGYALGFKDADAVTAEGNLLVDNGAGIFMDGTPFTRGGRARFEDNILAFNDVGIIVLTAVHGAAFQKNTFWENVEQVALQGGGKPGENDWQGNYWSDYTGFDADGNGHGEIPYRSERFFESLTDREPLLRVLIFSPAAQAIEMAATTFPVFKPQPKLEDTAPLSLPAAIPAWAIATAAPDQRAQLLLAGLGLLALSLLIINPRATGKPVVTVNTGGTPPVEPDSLRALQPSMKTPIIQTETLHNKQSPAIWVQGVSKHYGKATVLEAVTFSLDHGESLALWGANGAGKTTLVKAILGLIQVEGQIQVHGLRQPRLGKAIRQQIGYVPQEAIYYDMSVQATLAFYARLKKVSLARVDHLLEKLDLAEHARKSVQALSGGLKQRLALAIALLSDPPLLLLDEPTANLDARSRREYLNLLKELRKEGKALLFASHRLEEVEALADRVLLFERGKLIEELPPAALRQRLIPEAELALWIASEQRERALSLLKEAGLEGHINGRGTVVVQLDSGQKLKTMELMERHGVHVLDFDIQRVELWN